MKSFYVTMRTTIGAGTGKVPVLHYGTTLGCYDGYQVSDAHHAMFWEMAMAMDVFTRPRIFRVRVMRNGRVRMHPVTYF